MKIYECPQCGSLVVDQAKHNQSHSVIFKGTVYTEIDIECCTDCDVPVETKLE
jgi:hypothetical protein